MTALKTASLSQFRLTCGSLMRVVRQLLLALAPVVVCGAAFAQAYPSKPVHMIIPFPPGGTMDALIRLLGPEMSRNLGQPLVVESKPGASSVIGVDAAAKARPDGYTYVVVGVSFSVNATLAPKLPYDSLRDLQPVGLLAIMPQAFVGNPNVAANSLNELVELLKRDPDRLTYASFGNGTTAHLAAEQFKRVAGVSILHVPYKGLPIAMNELIAGHVDLLFANLSELLPHIRSGKLRAYGVTHPRRVAFAPEIPTIAEQGYPGFEFSSWYGVLAPAAVPKATVSRFNSAMNAALAHAETRDAMIKRRLDPLGGTPEEFGEFLRTEVAKHARLIRESGIKPD
jgi:tripartite-type tricarboxylate transporter receptor subunit TctC